MKRLLLLLTVLVPALLRAAPLSGTKSVGPTGDYASLTDAIADIQVQTVGGALVLELQATYLGSVETFPLTVPALNGASAVNSVTIRPATGATALSITSANTTAATVDLNGAQFVTFDGRPGGTGTAKQLNMANTSTSGVTVRFINEASSDALRFLTLQGVNTVNASGVVLFGSTTGANGNDDNTIDTCDTCDIRDGASTPKHLIYSYGATAVTEAQKNSGNTVTNCNLFNFYTSTVNDSTGIRLEDGNTAWSITGNSFYQTASRAALAANRPVRAIFLNTTGGNGFTVTGNFIGGDSPGAAVTTSKWTTTGTTAAYQFIGIQLNVGTTTPSSVQGNAISNIVWTSSSTGTTVGGGPFTGIYVQAGSADIGTVTGNTIGSGTGTGSISVTTAGSGGTTFGIGSASSGTVAIANNTIGSISVSGTTTSVSASLVGIQVTAGANIISNNVVGSTTTANSLNAATSSTSATAQQVTGILSSGSTSASITGNTVANLNNNYAGTSAAGQIRGIVTSAGVNTITGNTVRNLSTTSRNAQLQNANAAVQGIRQTSTTAGQTVSQNVVHSLASTATTTGVEVPGIYYAGPTTGNNVIARNLVHSLSIATTSTSSIMDGIFFQGGTFTTQNNMVRVGLDAGGVSTAGASLVRGIIEFSSTSVPSIYLNSVYVGGT